MFSVHAQVKYKKSVWGVVKGFIEKNTWAGLEDFYTALLRALQSEYCIPPAKAKGRRPRRGAAAGPQRMPLLLADATAALSGTDLVNSTKTPFALCSAVPSSAKSQLAGGGGVLSSLAPIKQTQSRMGTTTKMGVVLFMVVLVLLNVILYLKLWSLEDEAAAMDAAEYRDRQIFDFSLLK